MFWWRKGKNLSGAPGTFFSKLTRSCTIAGHLELVAFKSRIIQHYRVGKDTLKEQILVSSFIVV